MSKNSNTNKSNFLGMDPGKATHLLRRSIMFSMAKKLAIDVCYRCGEPIGSADELSIDHKLSWLYVSRDLFWDLDNVAFSHKKCNKTDRPELSRKYIPPDGMAWCYGCQGFKIKGLFSPDRRRGSGVSGICRSCINNRGTSHKARSRLSRWKRIKRVTTDVTAEVERLTSAGSTIRDAARAVSIPYETVRGHLKKSRSARNG